MRSKHAFCKLEIVKAYKDFQFAPENDTITESCLDSEASDENTKVCEREFIDKNTLTEKDARGDFQTLAEPFNQGFRSSPLLEHLKTSVQ